MGILRIVSLTAICAVALIDSAYAGGGPSPVPGPIAGAGIAGLDRWRHCAFRLVSTTEIVSSIRKTE